MMVRLTMERLRELQPAACETDARVVLDVETQQLFVQTSAAMMPLQVCSTRELRLIARQIEFLADHLDEQYESTFEEVKP